jgi:hypothetical protein
VEARQLRLIVRQMFRRNPVRMTPVKSRSITPALKTAIRAYARRNPEDSQHEIAQAFGVNGGRVSEALAGKRR